MAGFVQHSLLSLSSLPPPPVGSGIVPFWEQNALSPTMSSQFPITFSLETATTTRRTLSAYEATHNNPNITLRREINITCTAEVHGFPKARRLGYVGASTELGKLSSGKQKTTSEEKNGQRVQAEDVAEERYEAAPSIALHHAVNPISSCSSQNEIHRHINSHSTRIPSPQ